MKVTHAVALGSVPFSTRPVDLQEVSCTLSDFQRPLLWSLLYIFLFFPSCFPHVSPSLPPSSLDEELCGSRFLHSKLHKIKSLSVSTMIGLHYWMLEPCWSCFGLLFILSLVHWIYFLQHIIVFHLHRKDNY